MITINLKDFYPWYGSDEYIDVPVEVALELFADKRYEAAHERKMKRRKVISFSDYAHLLFSSKVGMANAMDKIFADASA